MYIHVYITDRTVTVSSSSSGSHCRSARVVRAGGVPVRRHIAQRDRRPARVYTFLWSSDGGAGCGDSVPGSGVCASREVPECGACGAVLRCERPGGTHAGSV